MAMDPHSEESHTFPPDSDRLAPLEPSCCVRISGREQSFLHCGEYIVLRDILAIDADVDGKTVTLHARVGQILQVIPTGDSQRILVSLLLLASDFPTQMTRGCGAAPPDRRQYVEYPTHVVISNIVKWFSGASILSEAFVFTENDLNTGVGAYSVGMENAFHARYRWEKDDSIFYPIGPETIASFPYNDCYSCCNWDLLVRVSTLINRELTRSFIAQLASKNQPLFPTKAEFQYLKERLKPDVEVYTKKGCQLISSHVSAQLKKALSSDARKSTFEWTLPSNLQGSNVFLEARLFLDSEPVHLVFPLFVLPTSTNGHLYSLAKTTP
jgi:hypothetical protein